MACRYLSEKRRDRCPAGNTVSHILKKYRCDSLISWSRSCPFIRQLQGLTKRKNRKRFSTFWSFCWPGVRTFLTFYVAHDELARDAHVFSLMHMNYVPEKTAKGHPAAIRCCKPAASLCAVPVRETQLWITLLGVTLVMMIYMYSIESALANQKCQGDHNS